MERWSENQGEIGLEELRMRVHSGKQFFIFGDAERALGAKN